MKHEMGTDMGQGNFSKKVGHRNAGQDNRYIYNLYTKTINLSYLKVLLFEKV